MELPTGGHTADELMPREAVDYKVFEGGDDSIGGDVVKGAGSSEAGESIGT